MSSPNHGSDHNSLMAVTVAKPWTFAVGDYFNGSSDRTLIESWTGATWVVMASPNASTKHNELDAVSGTSANDVWAVGRYEPQSGQERTLIEHWDGSGWTIVPSPNVGQYHNELDGVAAVSPTDVWAVGHYDEQPTPADTALIEHFDGQKWAVVANPRFLASVSDLNAISSTPKGGPIWAVGSQQYVNRSVTLVCELLGGVWRVVPSPNHGPFSNVLVGVAGISPRDMWAVGSDIHNGSSFAVTMHWDGQDVDLERVPRRLTTHYTLAAVSGDGQHRVFAVGDYFSGRVDVPVVLSWWDKQWHLVRTSVASPLHNELLGVTTATRATPVAVGRYFNGTSDRTLILRCRC
jgi:hypothetical protein